VKNNGSENSVIQSRPNDCKGGPRPQMKRFGPRVCGGSISDARVSESFKEQSH
jgi:hypothetical protein